MKCCHLEVNKVSCQTGLLKKMGTKKAKNINLTQNSYNNKRKSVTLTFSQSKSGDSIEWNLKPKPIIISNVNQIQRRIWMIWDHKTFNKQEGHIGPKSLTWGACEATIFKLTRIPWNAVSHLLCIFTLRTQWKHQYDTYFDKIRWVVYEILSVWYFRYFK